MKATKNRNLVFLIRAITIILTMICCFNPIKANAFGLFKKPPKGTIENPYKLPAPYGQSMPIDITKKGNKLETFIKIEEDYSYVFQLEFRYYDPRNDNKSKYYEGFWKKNLKMIGAFEKYFREYTKDEWAEIMKDNNRINKLVGYDELVTEDGQPYKGKLSISKMSVDEQKDLSKTHFVNRLGITNPVHLIITKIEKDGSQKVVFDEVRSDPKKIGSGTPTAFHKLIAGYEKNPNLIFSKGIYKISAESLKDSPELIGTDIYLNITKTLGAK